MEHKYVDEITSYKTGQGLTPSIEFEAACKISLLRLICGPEPSGIKLEIVWTDSEYDGLEVKTIHHPILALTWNDGILDMRGHAYLRKCKKVLDSLDELVSYDDLWELFAESNGSAK